jgi:hypothetical protein
LICSIEVRSTFIVSKNTYFALYPSQLEELKTVAERVFKLVNKAD